MHRVHTMRAIFKPTIFKIILFVGILIGTVFFQNYSHTCGWLPPAYTVTAHHGPTRVCNIGYPIFYGEFFYENYFDFGFSAFNLVINVIVYYSVASVLVLILDKAWRRQTK